MYNVRYNCSWENNKTTQKKVNIFCLKTVAKLVVIEKRQKRNKHNTGKTILNQKLYMNAFCCTNTHTHEQMHAYIRTYSLHICMFLLLFIYMFLLWLSYLCTRLLNAYCWCYCRHCQCCCCCCY